MYEERLIITDDFEEEWLPVTIPNNIKPNSYMISNKGHVRNIKSGKLLLPSLSKKGYLYVSLPTTSRNAKTGQVLMQKCTIHRLVYNHFAEDKSKIFDPQYVVNHKDGVKRHCEVTNLEWTTYAGNAIHAREHGLLNTGEMSITCKTTDETVRKICRLFEKGKTYKEIIQELRLPNDEYTKSLLVRIRTRTEWKEISKDYVFNSDSILRKHSDEYVDKICQGIEDGLMTSELFKMYGKDVPYQQFRKLVWNIRCRNTYRDISDKYTWWKMGSTTIDS